MTEKILSEAKNIFSIGDNLPVDRNHGLDSGRNDLPRYDHDPSHRDAFLRREHAFYAAETGFSSTEKTAGACHQLLFLSTAQLRDGNQPGVESQVAAGAGPLRVLVLRTARSSGSCFGILVVMPHPGHRILQAALVAPQRSEVQPVVCPDEQIESAAVA